MDIAKFIKYVNEGDWSDGYAIATMEFDIEGGFHAAVDTLRPRLTPTGYDILVNGEHHHTFTDIYDVVKVFTGHSIPYVAVFRVCICVKDPNDIVKAQRLLRKAKELCFLKKVLIEGDIWSLEDGIVNDIDTSFKPRPIRPIRSKLRALMCMAA